MANTNLFIAGSEGIEGNISSCRTELSVINGAERPSLFYVVDVGYATNNCTGQTDIYRSWELSGTSVFLIVVIAIAGIMTIHRILDN